uniref:Craniofacial development protein 1 n=1 Tax=Mesocestoides corti TaxID=53468 RepID=A0A5K3FD64_MESCO
MTDSAGISSESSDDEYIPPATIDESTDDSDDDESGELVLNGGAKNENKALVEIDRDEIWEDFLKGGKSDNPTNLVDPLKTNEPLTKSPPPTVPTPKSPPKSILAQPPRPSATKTHGTAINDRLSDVLKKLKSSTSSTGVPKMSTLEKSRLDWESFTEKEGIKDDLKLHNKGKNGYVERKAFEARTQEREYQMLREARLKSIQRR